MFLFRRRYARTTEEYRGHRAFDTPRHANLAPVLAWYAEIIRTASSTSARLAAVASNEAQ